MYKGQEVLAGDLGWRRGGSEVLKLGMSLGLEEVRKTAGVEACAKKRQIGLSVWLKWESAASQVQTQTEFKPQYHQEGTEEGREGGIEGERQRETETETEREREKERKKKGRKEGKER
jgi:hypothetical protein